LIKQPEEEDCLQMLCDIIKQNSWSREGKGWQTAAGGRTQRHKDM